MKSAEKTIILAGVGVISAIVVLVMGNAVKFIVDSVLACPEK